jgi:hypothetical protein
MKIARTDSAIFFIPIPDEVFGVFNTNSKGFTPNHKKLAVRFFL